MINSSNIILGTAQLESNYGILNNANGISIKNFKKIYSIEKKKLIETSLEYRCFNLLIQDKRIHNRIILKAPIKKIDTIEKIKKIFLKYNIKKIYCLMIHDLNKFLKLDKLKKEKIINNFKILKNDKYLQKFGFSCVYPNEIKKIKKTDIDILQIPFNVLDNNYVKNIKFLNKNVEIHARSLFLQGLLLSENNQIKKIIKKIPKKLILFKKKYQSIEERILVCRELLLKKKIKNVVIGFLNMDQYNQINKSFNIKTKTKMRLNNYFLNKSKLIKPYNW